MSAAAGRATLALAPSALPLPPPPPVIALAAGTPRALVLLTDKTLGVVVEWMVGWAVQVRRLSEYLFRINISAVWQRRCPGCHGVGVCEV